MKSSLLYFLVTIISFVLACGGSSPTNSEDESFSLEIIVTNSAGEPVPGIRISAWNQLEFVPNPPPPLSTALAPIDTASLLGDINCNGVAFEQVDLDDLKQFFILGDSAFFGHVACSRANADLNQDGEAPTLSDLVWLMRSVVGQSPPVGPSDSVNGRYSHTQSWVAVLDSLKISALLVTVPRLDFIPVLMDEQLSILGRFDTAGFVTRVLVTPSEPLQTPLESFTGTLLSGVFNASNLPILIEAVTPDGRPLRFERISRIAVMSRVYPNPSGSVFSRDLELTRPSTYSLTWYDANEIIIRSDSGEGVSGQIRFKWTPPVDQNAIYRSTLRVDGGGSIYSIGVMALHWTDNPDKNVFGFTSSLGSYTSTDSLRLLISHLYFAMRNVDASGNLVGSFRILDKCTIHLQDPKTGRTQEYEAVIGKGGNVIHLIWDWPF